MRRNAAKQFAGRWTNFLVFLPVRQYLMTADCRPAIEHWILIHNDYNFKGQSFAAFLFTLRHSVESVEMPELHILCKCCVVPKELLDLLWQCFEISCHFLFALFAQTLRATRLSVQPSPCVLSEITGYRCGMGCHLNGLYRHGTNLSHFRSAGF